MAENNAHIEPFEKRRKRFEEGSPIEIIETLLNSISNYFNNEIKLTVTENNFQTSLMFLGTHAIALTISEAFFNESGEKGYKKFLENFVDSEQIKFSSIADVVHDWRNILAHQWLGMSGHSIGYDYEQQEGWRIENGVTIINPKIYCDTFLGAFSSSGKIWRYDSLFSESELQEIKQRLLDKYLKK